MPAVMVMTKKSFSEKMTGSETANLIRTDVVKPFVKLINKTKILGVSSVSDVQMKFSFLNYKSSNSLLEGVFVLRFWVVSFNCSWDSSHFRLKILKKLANWTPHIVLPNLLLILPKQYSRPAVIDHHPKYPKDLWVPYTLPALIWSDLIWVALIIK